MKDVYEAFRKAMLDVLIPEIKQLEKEIMLLRQGQELLRQGQEESRKEMNQKFAIIIDKLDLAQRLAKLETIVEELRRKVA